MKQKSINYKVIINEKEYLQEAKTPGAAARKVFRELINNKILKRQPKSETDGGWKDVSIEPINGWINKR